MQFRCKELPFIGLGLGIFGKAILAAGIGYNDHNNGAKLGIYKQAGDTLEFFELYRQGWGRISAKAKASDFGMIICYKKDDDSFATHVATFKPGQNTFNKSQKILYFPLVENQQSIISVPSSGIFFVTSHSVDGKQPAISRFNMDCILLETKTLDELLPNAPKMEIVSGRMLTAYSILLWGVAKPAQWWFGIYDIRRNTVTKTALVAPGSGIMSELIYDIAVLKGGKLCVCTPAVLFMLNADFELEGYWTAEQEGPAGFDSVSIAADGNLLVLGSTFVERGGQAAVWLVRPQDFMPLPTEP
jgi:hypothetical protein